MQVLFETVFGAPWWLIIATAIYGLCWSVYGDLYSEANASHARWVHDLKANRWLAWYRRELGRALGWVDARLSPEVLTNRWPTPAVQVAWSGGLMALVTLLAVAYPVLGVVVQWGVLGADGRIGPLVVIPGGQPLWQRVATLGLLAFSFGAWYAASRVHGLRQFVLALVATGLASAFAFAVAVAVAFALPSALSIAVVAAFAAVLPAAGMLAVSIIFTSPLADTHKYLFEGAREVALPVLVALAVASAFAVAVQTFAARGAFVLPVAFAGAYAAEWAGRRLQRPATTQLLWLILLLVALWAMVGRFYSPQPGVAEGIPAVVLFLVVLPILNALADFASTGLTRYTLRRGVAREASVWVWGALDAIGGLLILLLLGGALIAFVHVTRPPDGSTLIDLGALFADLRASPADYWWLYAMLFTTLLPTALHLLFASFGGVLQLSPWLRDHIAEGLEAGAEGDRVRGRWAVQWLCLAITISVMAPIIVTGLIWVNIGSIGLAFLDLFEGFALWLGVEIERPPPVAMPLATGG